MGERLFLMREAEAELALEWYREYEFADGAGGGADEADTALASKIARTFELPLVPSGGGAEAA